MTTEKRAQAIAASYLCCMAEIEGRLICDDIDSDNPEDHDELCPVWQRSVIVPALLAFAESERAQERERCAMIAEIDSLALDRTDEQRATAREIAKTIRKL